MRSVIVVERDPIASGAAGVGDALEALAVYALFFEWSDQSLHHAVLLRTMRCDELLLQAITPDGSGVFAGCKNQPVVAAEQEWRLHSPQCPELCDQRVLQCRSCC